MTVHTTGDPLYHAIFLDPTGVVITSGDDLVDPIIAFLTGSTFDPSPSNPFGALVSGDVPARVSTARTEVEEEHPSGVDAALGRKFARAYDVIHFTVGPASADYAKLRTAVEPGAGAEHSSAAWDNDFRCAAAGSGLWGQMGCVSRDGPGRSRAVETNLQTPSLHIGLMPYGTKLYWNVIASNSSASIESPVWSFTTSYV